MADILPMHLSFRWHGYNLMYLSGHDGSMWNAGQCGSNVQSNFKHNDPNCFSIKNNADRYGKGSPTSYEIGYPCLMHGDLTHFTPPPFYVKRPLFPKSMDHAPSQKRLFILHNIGIEYGYTVSRKKQCSSSVAAP